MSKIMSCQESICILFRYIIKFHFLDVKKKRKPTPSQAFGSNCHVLLMSKASNVFPQNSIFEQVLRLSLQQTNRQHHVRLIRFV
jgi:hypothetical protein